MKLLFDENLSHKLCARLQDAFPGAGQVQRLGLANADDLAIWEYAKTHDLIIVSHDVGFANLSSVRGHPPKVIWLRCGNQPTSVIGQLLRSQVVTIEQFAQDPTLGCLELVR